MPVKTPNEVIEAVPVPFVTDQTPPEVLSARVIEFPAHTEEAPVIGLTIGEAFTVNVLLLVPMPLGVVTLTVPVVPEPTTAII